jgi:thiosulfate dehydrogenase [quinone] large subunit
VNRLPSSQAYAWWLAVLRILTGGIWLVRGIPKFTQSASFMPPGGAMTVTVARGLQLTSPGSPYHNFLAHVVQPYIGFFAELVRLGEVLIGVSLVLGVLARFGGLGGVILTLCYMAASGGIGTFAAWQGLDACLLLLSLTNLVLPTGRMLGIDGFFGQQRAAAVPAPSSTVRAEFVDEPPLYGPMAPTQTP